MKYKEQAELVAGLRELADFFEKPTSIVLPCPHVTILSYIYEYATDVETGHTRYDTVDEFATRLKMRDIAKAMKPVDKKHEGATFSLERKFGKLVRLRYQTTREAICRKKVIETKEVAEFVIPAHTEEVIEWECTDPLLA